MEFLPSPFLSLTRPSLPRSYSLALAVFAQILASPLIREFQAMYEERFNGVANYVDDGNSQLNNNTRKVSSSSRFYYF